ncbi:MAG TPA: biotin--[acetyl-CoA-carboxylase] ligase [Bauldia sp.]|nr:biotin--[acetyl-CoA-carboxylase] ligase [Bauldia sp.]
MADRLPPGYRRQSFATLGSTNTEAFAAARGGDAGNLWVTTEEQTAGHGRRGRTWIGGRGNVAASLLLIDPAPPALAPTIAFVAGIALHQAVVDIAGPAVAERVKLKWPNDLLLDRMKVAGISVEGDRLADRRFAVVIGFGVNCRVHPESETLHPATDFAARNIPVEAEHLLGRLAERMAGELERWQRGSNFRAVRTAWLARSAGLGEPIRVRLADRSLDGRFDSLDDDGRLVVALGDGRREAVSAGDVFLGGLA